MPEGIVSIEEKAFYNTELESLILPDGVEETGKDAICNYRHTLRVFFLGGSPSEFSEETITYPNNVAFYYVEGTQG